MGGGYGDYPDLARVKRVLVVCLKNIGDVVLASPVFSALKGAVPGASVDALVNGGTEDVLVENPDIGEVIVLDRRALKGVFSRLAAELRLLGAVRSGKYDMVVTLSSGSRGRNVALLSGARIRVGPEPKKKKIFGVPYFTDPVRHAPRGRHYVERNLDCLRRVGIFPEPGARRTTFFEGAEATSRARGLLDGAGIKEGEPYMVAHPTSRWMFKCWPAGKVAGLIDRVRTECGLRVVLTSGPDGFEKAYVADLLEALTTEVVDFSARLSLRELGAVVRGARLFFGVDSAPMHIAAAVGTPVVALFGPTSAVDWAPWGEGHRVITSPDHECVPCGRDGCGGSKVSECLTDIGISTVFEAVRDGLRGDV